MPLTLAGATLASGAIGGLSSLVGNIFGSNSQKKANETNMKINQMNNEFNERMMDKQIAYEKEMWNANNEYNSAASQAERWREAGMNPSMMMGNANAGIASSGSVSAASAAPSAPQQAFKPDFSGVSNALMGMIENSIRLKDVEADVKLKDAQSEALTARAAVELDSLREDLESKRTHNRYLDQTLKKTLEGMDVSRESGQAEAEYKRTMNAYQKMVNEKFPVELAAKLALIRAQTGLAKYQSGGKVIKTISDIETLVGKIPDKYKPIVGQIFEIFE